MTEVAVIVRDALCLIGVCDIAEAPSAEEEQIGLRQLNLMMRKWESDGWPLGWTDVDSPADDLPAPPWAEDAITQNLAVRLCQAFAVVLTADLASLATDGRATVAAAVARSEFSRLSYPDLPCGTRRLGAWHDGYNC